MEDRLKDVIGYEADLAVIQSHITAATTKLDILFMRNTGTHQLDNFEEFGAQLDGLKKRLRLARKKATARLNEYT